RTAGRWGEKLFGRSGVNTSAPLDAKQAEERVLGWQTKLHRWAGEEREKRFGDLFNLVCDPATLLVAWERVKRNRGSRTAGVDGQTRKHIEAIGVEEVLSELRQDVEQLGDAVLLDVGDGLLVDASRTAIGAHQLPRALQHVPAEDL